MRSRGGSIVNGVQFGIAAPPPGGALHLPLHVANHGQSVAWVFGFVDAYPRTLRVSPPKEERPWVRISFADANVLHPPDAFIKVPPGGTAQSTLDISFAFNLAETGAVDVLFVYEEVRGQMIKAWNADEGIEAGSAKLTLTPA